jgi:hypothetical protein
MTFVLFITTIFHRMSLQLESLAQRIYEYTRSHSETQEIPFLYSEEYLKLSDLCCKTREKLLKGTYGQKTTERARELLSKWEEIQNLNPLPPLQKLESYKIDQIAEIITWTLQHCGFAIESSNASDELVHASFTSPMNQKMAHLRIVRISDKYIRAYLDSLSFNCNHRLNKAHEIPLRFQLSCIIPWLCDGPQPRFDSVPPEITANILTYMSMEEMGSLATVSKQMKASFDSDILWSHVWSNFEGYLTGTKPAGTKVDIGEHKNAIANIVLENQRRRESRFVHSTSDWTGPIHFIDRSGIVDPIRSLRRRRIDVMDDLDLFM